MDRASSLAGTKYKDNKFSVITINSTLHISILAMLCRVGKEVRYSIERIRTLGDCTEFNNINYLPSKYLNASQYRLAYMWLWG